MSTATAGCHAQSLEGGIPPEYSIVVNCGLAIAYGGLATFTNRCLIERNEHLRGLDHLSSQRFAPSARGYGAPASKPVPAEAQHAFATAVPIQPTDESAEGFTTASRTVTDTPTRLEVGGENGDKRRQSQERRLLGTPVKPPAHVGGATVNEAEMRAISVKRFLVDHIVQFYLMSLLLCLGSMILLTTTAMRTFAGRSFVLIEFQQDCARHARADWSELPVASLLYFVVMLLLLALHESIPGYIPFATRRRDMLTVTALVAAFALTLALLVYYEQTTVAEWLDVGYAVGCAVVCVAFAVKLPRQLKELGLADAALRQRTVLLCVASCMVVRAAMVQPYSQSALPQMQRNTLPIIMTTNAVPIGLAIWIMRSGRNRRLTV